MNTATIIRGTWVVVNLRASCGHERPHSAEEDGLRGLITVDSKPGDHSLFVLYQGRARESRFPSTPHPLGFGRLPLGRVYRPDELEAIPEPA
jgi:hypothetical protein